MNNTEEIFKLILQEKEKQESLNGLTSISRVSQWRLFAYVVAYVIDLLRQMFEVHKQEVSNTIAELKPGTPKWYRNKALDFQYGFDLYTDSDKFNNEGYTEEEIQASKIVKYAAVTEAASESRLIIKIAGETEETLNPITELQKEAFTYYLEEIRYAGVAITVINYLPDLLYLNITIKRDPLVLDNQGNALAPVNGNIRPVETAIKEFLRELPFNGELVLSKLTDKLQQTIGIKDIIIDNASTAWIDPQTGGYGSAIGVYMSKIPESGYFTTKNGVNDLVKINYVV